MSKPKLHLDADTSMKAIFNGLTGAGHDVTRTPNDWMEEDATDQEQLLGATAQGRIIFTFNIRDFMPLAGEYLNHHGILLASQSKWTPSQLIKALDRALSETEEKDWIGQVHWLTRWRD